MDRPELAWHFGRNTYVLLMIPKEDEAGAFMIFIGQLIDNIIII